jgi:uncharacterized membrane protein
VRGHDDLRLVVLLAGLGAAIAIVVPWEAVRIVAALPLALFLPGYAIAAAAFAGHPINRPQKLMLCLACSLAVLALGGILLTYLPGGIRTLSWALLLLLVVVAACRSAALRRPPASGTQWGDGLRLKGIRRVDIAIGAGTAAAVVAALILAYTPLPAGNAAGYTALWMLSGHGRQSGQIQVGVDSSEHRLREYRLEVAAGGGGSRIFTFALDPGEETAYNLPLRLPSGKPERVEASLFRLSRPNHLYRRVVLWLPEPGRGG